jgi:hypothetical protein
MPVKEREGESKQNKSDNRESEEYRISKKYDKVDSDERDLSAKRSTKWLLFSKGRAVLGFDRLPKSLVPSNSSKPRGLTLSFEKISGWSIPVDLLQDFDAGKYDISVQLCLSMFHLESKTFFGSTWMGTSIFIAESDKTIISDIIDINYNEIIYLITKLNDPTCVAVVEIVVSRISKDSEIIISQHG